MKRIFLKKFFPASRTATIRKEICRIRQQSGETLHEFNKLCVTCPHHQISEQLLIQYFYEGLSMMDRRIIDAASGGALMDKTPAVARHLISNMASNIQQFGIRGPSQSRMLAVGKHQPALAAKVCGICTFVEHPTDMCPMLQETESDQPENVGAIGGYQYGKQIYQSWPLDNQQYGRQPFWPRPNQGPYAAQQFESTSNALSTIDSTISSTTIPTASAIENANSRQLSISKRPDEQHPVPAEYDRHHPRPHDADRIVSQHCEPITQPSFSNNSESEREHECSYVEKWKGTISTSIAVAEINRSQLRIGCQLIVSAKENCPNTVSNSDHLGKEA
ncbi:hypothetical protein CR513_15179, partial [Mucuna pruriens]